VRGLCPSCPPVLPAPLTMQVAAFSAHHFARHLTSHDILTTAGAVGHQPFVPKGGDFVRSPQVLRRGEAPD
jgi:hypothetical protein